MEYRVITAKSLINEDQLNELAQDGWLLVCVVPVEYTYYFYFNRHRTAVIDELVGKVLALEETPDG